MSRLPSGVGRTDLLAGGLLLSAGIAAQGAMWSANSRSVYPVAAALLITVTLVGGWQRSRRLATPLRVTLQMSKLLGCVGLLAFAISTGALALPQRNMAHVVQRPSMTVTIGVLLLVVQLVQAATATSRRDLALSAPIVVAMLTQAGMAAHDAAPAPWFGVALAAMVSGLAVVFRGELLAESTASAEKTGGRRGVAARLSATVLKVAAIATVVFLLLPNSLDLHTTPVAHAAGPPSQSAPPQSTTSQTPLDAHSQAIADPAAGELDLRVRGALSNLPVFVVAADAPAYWQGVVYDRYDGTSWTTTGDVSRAWAVDPSTTPAVQRAPDPGPVPAAGLQRRSDSVQMVSAQPQRVVFAPGRAITYVGPGRVSSDVDGTPRLALADGGAPSSRDYDVVSIRPNQPAGPVSGNDATDPRWLQLPAELPQRVKSLSAQLIGGAPTRAAAVSAINDYLHRNETYNLTAPVPGPGVDAVDSFLFDSHLGFCEQFATAAVVLLRASGVPSRLVTGYSQGDLTSEPGKRVMRGSDAHAWVQVWYPGVGWVDDDPTANAVLSTPDAASATPSASPSASPSTAPSAAASPQPVPTASEGGERSVPGGRLGLAALLLAALAFGQLVVSIGRRRARARPTRTPATPGGGGGPVLQAYLRLDAALTAAGRGRAPDETPRTLAVRLGSAPGVEVADAQIAAAVDLLEHECYAVEPLTSAQTASAVNVFNELTKSVKSLAVLASAE